MDNVLDQIGHDNFYDEIASLMPMPSTGEFNLGDDLDEILRSTDSHLESSLDFSSFVSMNNTNDGILPDFSHRPTTTTTTATTAMPEMHLNNDNFTLDFTNTPFSITPATNPVNVAAAPSYQSQRTISSSSSTLGDHFNPEEFMNFLNDDEIKFDEYTKDYNHHNLSHHHRPHHDRQHNTPSPTDSCSSSSGSSTSGIQSDASSSSSSSATQKSINIQLGNDEEMNDDFMSEFVIKNEYASPQTPVIETGNAFISTSVGIQNPMQLPIQLPVLPVSPGPPPPPTTTTAATTINVMENATSTGMGFVPVKTMPLTTLPTTSTVNGLQATPKPLKVEPKIAPKIQVKTTTATPNVNLINTNGQTTTTTTTNAANKPKTIFLSSNDFKALMQKMNNPNGKSAKISGGLNGQMPKIIMKTPNGKVITANKIATATAGASNNGAIVGNTATKTQLSPTKIIKTTTTNGASTTGGSRQSPAKVAGTTSATMSTTGRTSNSKAPLGIYKGIIDEKMLKKQQRMIKNRESASLSRKKKKEYVVSLETRINNLEKENFTLKGENTSLRSQLVAFAKQCHCRHRNVSEFILNTLNTNGNIDDDIKLNAFSHDLDCEHPQQHVKIGTKPIGSSSPKHIKQRMSAANIRKNVAVLFAMAFMVTLNVGNFQNYLNKNPIENSGEITEETMQTGGRRLLWVETETEFKEKLNRSKQETGLEVPPPPLHFLRPINRTNMGEQFPRKDPPPLTSTKCNTVGSANQTENFRLHSNLHKWIDGNGYLNLSLHEKIGKDLENPTGFKLTSDYMHMKTMDLPLQRPIQNKRKLYFTQEQMETKQRRFNDGIRNGNENGHDNGNRNRNGNGNGINANDNDESNDVKNSLDLFKPKLSEEYVRLFNGIQRKDDTFYVLSFNMDHILLPASAYNKSARPKMSLMLPAGDPSVNGDVVLMQIDCDVTNTTEVVLKSEQIPEKLRPQKETNNIKLEPTAPKSAVANNITGGGGNNGGFNSTNYTNVGGGPQTKPRVAELRLKEKPVVRTYVMMGPKTKAAAEAMKKEPTLVKLDPSNESVLSSGMLNMGNSTLFAKMRETVVADFANSNNKID